MIELLIIWGAVAAVPVVVGILNAPGWFMRRRLSNRVRRLRDA